MFTEIQFLFNIQSNTNVSAGNRFIIDVSALGSLRKDSRGGAKLNQIKMFIENWIYIAGRK